MALKGKFGTFVSGWESNLDLRIANRARCSDATAAPRFWLTKGVPIGASLYTSRRHDARASTRYWRAAQHRRNVRSDKYRWTNFLRRMAD